MLFLQSATETAGNENVQKREKRRGGDGEGQEGAKEKGQSDVGG